MLHLCTNVVDLWLSVKTLNNLIVNNKIKWSKTIQAFEQYYTDVYMRLFVMIVEHLFGSELNIHWDTHCFISSDTHKVNKYESNQTHFAFLCPEFKHIKLAILGKFIVFKPLKPL